MSKIDQGVMDALRDILPESRWANEGGGVSVEWQGDEVVVNYSGMYEAPGITHDQVGRVRDLFGGTDVRLNRDAISTSGCESCDYGSDYGHLIYVVGPTRNLPGRNP